MTNEEAIEWLVSVKERTIADLPKAALDIAIKALETGEVYMTGEDYNLYMEGYKAGKKDFAPKQGEWIVKSNGTTNYYACNKCGNAGDIQDKFCRECGADMRGVE